MVKNKHIEDLSQGYRWGWEWGELLIFFKSIFVCRSSYSIYTVYCLFDCQILFLTSWFYPFWNTLFLTPEPLKTFCTRAWWSTWMWMRRMTVRSPFMNTWLASEWHLVHPTYLENEKRFSWFVYVIQLAGVAASLNLFLISVESQHTWRSSPSPCSGCVLASFPTPTTTSHPGTHTSALWASRPWVRPSWAGSSSQQAGHYCEDLKSFLKHPPRSCSVYFCACIHTNTDSDNNLILHQHYA